MRYHSLRVLVGDEWHWMHMQYHHEHPDEPYKDENKIKFNEYNLIYNAQRTTYRLNLDTRERYVDCCKDDKTHKLSVCVSTGELVKGGCFAQSSRYLRLLLLSGFIGYVKSEHGPNEIISITPENLRSIFRDVNQFYANANKTTI